MCLVGWSLELVSNDDDSVATAENHVAGTENVCGGGELEGGGGHGITHLTQVVTKNRRIVTAFASASVSAKSVVEDS